ncbi:MAG TPA: dihydrofolate reductase family protein [Acidimicrobiia bacterium]|nr:dihydrofolate reductase family protein [Acidimicrobiia bacterium]
MKLTVTTFVTLDGVMQGPGGHDEDLSNGFELGGWVSAHIDEDFGRRVDDIFSRADAILLGRTTYEMMYAYWSQFPDEDNVVASGLNNLPKHIATSHPDGLSWNNASPIEGDLVETVRKLKEQPGRELQVHGSHGVIQTLLKAGLVDEINLFIFPVVLGEGKRLFGPGTVPAGMKLENGEISSTGVVIATYRPTGAPVLQEAA